MPKSEQISEATIEEIWSSSTETQFNSQSPSSNQVTDQVTRKRKRSNSRYMSRKKKKVVNGESVSIDQKKLYPHVKQDAPNLSPKVKQKLLELVKRKCKNGEISKFAQKYNVDYAKCKNFIKYQRKK